MKKFYICTFAQIIGKYNHYNLSVFKIKLFHTMIQFQLRICIIYGRAKLQKVSTICTEFTSEKPGKFFTVHAARTRRVLVRGVRPLMGARALIKNKFQYLQVDAGRITR